uniref:hypothetical protein n=1 Tax=uncultured Salegentibacter sp. TaxID=259320 RepID=UPI0030DA30F7
CPLTPLSVRIRTERFPNLCSNFRIIIQQKRVASLSQSVRGDGPCEDKAVGDMPVTSPRVGIFPRFPLVQAKLDKHLFFRANAFPLFPDTHP